jgi:hypothetical protein
MPQQTEILSIHHTPSEALEVEVTGSWDRGLRNRIMTTDGAKSSAGAVSSRQPPRRVVRSLATRRDGTEAGEHRFSSHDEWASTLNLHSW